MLRGGGDVRIVHLIDLSPVAGRHSLGACSGWWFTRGFYGLSPSSMENIIKTVWGLLRFRSRAWIHDVTLSLCQED